jgi:hypothetical protein
MSGGSGGSSMAYGLHCVRCGAALELPDDPNAVYMDCPFCGQDNVLPQYLIDARQRQYAIAMQARLRQQQLAQQAVHQAAARRRSRRTGTVVFLLLAFLVGVPLLGVGSCMALAFYAAGEQVEAEKRAKDRSVNGAPQIEADLRKLRASGCTNTVIQPTPYLKHEASFWLEINDMRTCAHLLAATGVNQNRLSIRAEGAGVEFDPPAPAQRQNVRFCAAQPRRHDFKVESSTGDPFTVAVIACPRQPGEGGVRSTEGDDATTGQKRMAALLKELHSGGCTHVVSSPSVVQGPVSYTLTSVKGGQCYNFFAVSSYPDVKFTFSLQSPLGERLPVPSPSHEARLIYCPRVSGKHELRVETSTQDHYTVAALDCPRNSREGLRREQEMIAKAK